jgi:hypothetical protein
MTILSQILHPLFVSVHICAKFVHNCTGIWFTICFPSWSPMLECLVICNFLVWFIYKGTTVQSILQAEGNILLRLQHWLLCLATFMGILHEPSHPLPLLRAQESSQWAQSTEYKPSKLGHPKMQLVDYQLAKLTTILQRGVLTRCKQNSITIMGGGW